MFQAQNVATFATFKAQKVATVATFKAQQVATLKNAHRVSKRTHQGKARAYARPGSNWLSHWD